jgi:hypothetical protein
MIDSKRASMTATAEDKEKNRTQNHSTSPIHQRTQSSLASMLPSATRSNAALLAAGGVSSSSSLSPPLSPISETSPISTSGSYDELKSPRRQSIRSELRAPQALSGASW